MKYCSTRDKSLNFDFKEIFQRSLAPDGGLFVPKKIKKFNINELKRLKKLSYINLAVEVISKLRLKILLITLIKTFESRM